MGFFYSQLFVTPKYPTKSFTGQTIIVTGSNVGLGKEAARHFARLDAAKVILGVRNLEAGRAAAKDIEASTHRSGVCEVWELDLSQYSSVKAFAARASKLDRIDVVLENAAIATGTFNLAEYHERTITINVISTCLLALLLLPKLRETSKKYNIIPRLSIVTSEVHAWPKFPEKDAEDIFEALDKPGKTMGERYPTSKLLEVLYVRAIAPRLATQDKTQGQVILNMLNPGLCHSELAREAGWGLWLFKLLLARSTEIGSRTLVAGAVAGEDSHGKYMSDGVVHEDMVVNWVKNTQEGKTIQEKVYTQLNFILEKIEPGLTKGLSK